jgi:tetratricopeptide (TPR) repeat protein
MAIRAGDFDTAALALANLILINRNRNRFRAVVYLMQRYFQQIPIKKISPEYRYRLFKELFIYYHETDNFPRAMIYLDRLQRIDSSLMMYTPSDDWIPGIIRWRKAHLGWIMDPSGKSLMRSVAEAQEGVIYLQEALHENPNSAGLASAYLNVGWLYFIQDNPVCLDYFDQAVQNALDFSPRTEGQAMLAQAFAEAKFGLESHENALGKAFIALGRLAAGGYAQRSYAFLQKDREWKFVKYCLDLWVRMGNLRTG